MRWRLRALITVPLLFVTLNLTLVEIAEAVELTIELTDARLNTLRASGKPDTDKTLKAYESTRTWLSQAASHNRDTANYFDALISAPKQEAEFQMQLDALEATHDTRTELETLSQLELKAQLTVTSTKLRSAINELDAVTQRLASRETTARFIRIRLEEIDQRLDVISTLEVPVTIDLHAPPSITEALQWITVAEQMALIAERRAQEANLKSLPARLSSQRAKAAVLEIKVRKLGDRKRAMEAIARQTRLDLAEPKALGIGPDNPVHAIAERLTLNNTQLRDQRLDIESLLNAIRANQDEVERVTRFCLKSALQRPGEQWISPLTAMSSVKCCSLIGRRLKLSSCPLLSTGFRSN